VLKRAERNSKKFDLNRGRDDEPGMVEVDAEDLCEACGGDVHHSPAVPEGLQQQVDCGQPWVNANLITFLPAIQIKLIT